MNATTARILYGLHPERAAAGCVRGGGCAVQPGASCWGSAGVAAGTHSQSQTDRSLWSDPRCVLTLPN
eukprot:6499233-Prymnesium_polylepis.4